MKCVIPLKPVCPECKGRMNRKFMVQEEDKYLPASYCYQCPDCKNIEEV